MTTQREGLAALSLALRQAARAYLGLSEGEHWDSGIADAQARALTDLPKDDDSTMLPKPEVLWNHPTMPLAVALDRFISTELRRGNRDRAEALMSLARWNDGFDYEIPADDHERSHDCDDCERRHRSHVRPRTVTSSNAESLE